MGIAPSSDNTSLLELLEWTPSICLHHLRCIFSKPVWWYNLVFPTSIFSSLLPSQTLLPHISELYSSIGLTIASNICLAVLMSGVMLPTTSHLTEPADYITSWSWDLVRWPKGTNSSQLKFLFSRDYFASRIVFSLLAWLFLFSARIYALLSRSATWCNIWELQALWKGDI